MRHVNYLLKPLLKRQSDQQFLWMLRAVVLVFGVGLFQLFDGVGQRFADEAAAINAKVAFSVGLLVVRHRLPAIVILRLGLKCFKQKGKEV